MCVCVSLGVMGAAEGRGDKKIVSLIDTLRVAKKMPPSGMRQAPSVPCC